MTESRTSRRVAGALQMQPLQSIRIRQKVHELMQEMSEVGMGLPEMIATFRGDAVILTMLELNGNQTRTAKRLKICRNRLHAAIELWLEMRIKARHARG